jgi:hypothetical protein
MSFNWINYKALNPDLANSGLKTRKEYERHYITRGKKEGRKYIKPAAKPVTKSVTKLVAKPVTKPVAKPVTKPVTKSVTKPVAKPITKPAAKPVTKSVTKPITKPVAKPVTKSVTKPVTKPVAKPVTKPVAKSVTKTVDKILDKTVDKPVPPNSLKKFYIISNSMMKINLDHTHLLSNRKFAAGFAQNGYEVIEIIGDENTHRIENNYGNIILFFNSFDYDKVVLFAQKYDNLFYLLWAWHNIPISNIPFKHYRLTFQQSVCEPSDEKYKNTYYTAFEQLKADNTFVYYTFASYIDPDSDFLKLNNGTRTNDVLYIGSNYETSTVNAVRGLKNINSFIRVGGGGNGCIVGKAFEDLYRCSKICLGLMSPENNKDMVITERIWEAFSFGTMVLTNSVAASIILKDAVVYFNGTQDCLNKIDYYLKNDSERQRVVENGYNIFRSYGSYKHVANTILNNIF